MRSAILLGRDHRRIGALELVAEGPCAVALSRDAVIGEEALPPTLLRRPKALLPTEIPADGVNLEAKLADYERALLTEAMHLAGGVKKHAAQLLRISFRSFRYRFEKLGLDDPKEGG